MKKTLAIMLALAMVLTLAACGGGGGSSSTPKQEEPTSGGSSKTEPEEPTQTSWSAVTDFSTESSTGVWKYYFFDSADSSYNEMGGYEERSDGSLCEWYPWEGSWVGVGINHDAEGLLELNNEGPDGMRGVLAFCAPADGTYVFSGELSNPWGQNFGTFTMTANGEAVVTAEINSSAVATYHLNPTEITLAAGEIVYIECTSTGDWVSAYVDLLVEQNGTAGEYLPTTEGAIDEFSIENADGTWVYASTTDGVTYTLMPSYKEEDWANGWFSEGGVGLDFQTSEEYSHMLEINCDNSSGEAAALGYKAAADGKYTFTVYTKEYSEWGQDGHIAVTVDGEEAATLPMVDLVAECTVELTLREGQIVYFRGVPDNDQWLSAFLSVQASYEATEIVEAPVNVGAYAEFSAENADGTWVYASTTDGVTFTLASYYDEPDWDGDGQSDAAQWYSESGTGVGRNYSVSDLLEVNHGNGEMTVLGYKAAADGTYTLNVYTLIHTDWGQSGYYVVSLNGEQLQTIENDGDVALTTIEVTLKAGEVVYIYGVSTGDWLSAYLNVIVS